MIIWVASYPQSGDSVLRQILQFTMGKVSFSEHIESDELWGRAEAWGRYPTYEEFKAWAVDTAEPVFVKTHALPADHFPALYIVRDGRAAIASFLKLEQHLSPESRSNSLLQLILGDHYYGDWTEHYQAWTGRSDAPTLVLRNEDILDADAEALRRIASFIDHEGPVEPWGNPIDESQRRVPDFVCEGKTTWTVPPGWDFFCDRAFWLIHGPLMEQLGLGDDTRVSPPGGGAPALVDHAVLLMRDWVGRMRELDRRLVRQDIERGLQTAIAAERLAALEKLRVEQDVLARTMEALRIECSMQSAAAAERLDLIQRLNREHATATTDRLEALDALERERDHYAALVVQKVAELDALQAELATQIGAASERLAALEEIAVSRDRLTAALNDQAAGVEVLRAERDALATAADERLAALEGLDRARNLDTDRPRAGWR